MVQKLQSLGIDRMTVSERLDLIAAIWDSIPEPANASDAPEWHMEEIKRRLATADSDPKGSKPWNEIKARLEKKP
ncbi:MAG: addiction module protein [Planctomycetes bacterium]|nr:addiction module protein [Planctomycetota bacterium]